MENPVKSEVDGENLGVISNKEDQHKYFSVFRLFRLIQLIYFRIQWLHKNIIRHNGGGEGEKRFPNSITKKSKSKTKQTEKGIIERGNEDTHKII